MDARLETIGAPLQHIPVLHTCGHFEVRLTRWNAFDPATTQDTANPDGFLPSGAPCSTCDPQGRPAVEHFDSLSAAQDRATEKNEARERFASRIESRRERLENASDRAVAESAARLGKANRIADGIPLGQPILLQHHSERRHRADIARIDANTRKGIEASKAADDLSRRADAVGTGGISSDDPDAIEKLEIEADRLERSQERMKAANKFVRKGDRAGLAAAGFTEKQIDDLLTPDFAGRLGFPSYALTNNSSNIRRIRQRIAYLRKMAQTPAIAPIAGDGWILSEDVEDNRIAIAFDTKPDRAMLDNLRRSGFRWSPSRGAHVRQRSNGALYAAKRLLGIE